MISVVVSHDQPSASVQLGRVDPRGEQGCASVLDPRRNPREEGQHDFAPGPNAFCSAFDEAKILECIQVSRNGLRSLIPVSLGEPRS